MNLETQWVVGFIDGEGCFFVGCLKRNDMALGYQIQPELTVVQHEQDIQVLHGLKEFFKCGSVTRNHGDRWCWRVKNLQHFLNIILPFFEKHPLKTKRYQEFLVFRDICLKMQNNEHLNPEGFLKVKELAENLRVQTAEQKAKKLVAKVKRATLKAETTKQIPPQDSKN